MNEQRTSAVTCGFTEAITCTSETAESNKRKTYEHPSDFKFIIIKKKAAVCPAVLVSQLPVVVCAVPLDVDSTDTLAQFWTSRPLLLLAVRATVVVSPTRGLEQGVVGQRHSLVKQGVQSLLVDSRFREFHLRRSDCKETLKSHHPA